MEIASRALRIRFDPQTGGIAGIAALPSGHEFLHAPAEKPLLWRLVLHDTEGKEVVLDNTQAPAPDIRKQKAGLALRWAKVDLPGEKAALEVRAACNLEGNRDTALLRLWVRSRSRAFGLWRVDFPVVSPLSQTSACDVAIGRGNWGELHAGAKGKVAGDYPSHNLPMQLLLVNEGQDGLYLAAHDPHARPKQFEMTPGGEFRVGTWVDGMGVPGAGWSAPYPFALGVYTGDWSVGCKRYRSWATREAPWAKKGPLADRADVPETMKKVCAWLNASGTREEVVPAVRKFAEAVGAPVGVHWYNWHQIPFDKDYPAYLPAKPGFSQGAAELVREGVVVMPYINARLWDTANAEFENARQYTAKDEHGNPTIEEYGSGAKLAVMCPTQLFWQARVEQIIQRLRKECRVNAVYLDQIGSAAPRRCFDPNHGHAIGSGAWWVDGYRRMLSPIKEWCASRGVGLTTENDAEPYMDNIDGHLIWTPRDANEIPMTTAVYGGYTLYFGSNRAFGGGDVAYCLCQARDFTWGAQLGWDGPALTTPEHAAKLQFLGALARLRSHALDVLAYGELMEVLRPENDVSDLTGTWNTWQGDRPVTLKAVQAALWRARDGAPAIVLANADTQGHDFRCTLDADRQHLGRAQHWTLSRLTPAGPEPAGTLEGRRPVVSVSVPGRDGMVLLVRPAK